MFKKDLDAKFSDEYLEICVKAKGMYQNSFIGKAVFIKKNTEFKGNNVFIGNLTHDLLI